MDEATIRMQSNMYALVAEMNSVIASVEGMKAENMQRSALGQSMAYTEESFAIREVDLMVISRRLRDEI